MFNTNVEVTYIGSLSSMPKEFHQAMDAYNRGFDDKAVKVSDADIKLQALAQARAEVEQLDQQATGEITTDRDDEPGTATR